MTALKEQYKDEANQGIPRETFKFRIKGKVNQFILSYLLKVK